MSFREEATTERSAQKELSGCENFFQYRRETGALPAEGDFFGPVFTDNTIADSAVDKPAEAACG